MEHMLDKDVERVLFSEEELHRRVAEIAAEIDRDYAGREPLLVSVLRGSFVFMADLVRQIHLPCTVDFMAVSSYGAGTASSGQVRIIKDLSEHIEGRDVIVVEDILDSGNTLSYLLQLLQADFIRRPDLLVIHHHKRVAHAKKMLRAQFRRQHDQRSDREPAPLHFLCLLYLLYFCTAFNLTAWPS